MNSKEREALALVDDEQGVQTKPCLICGGEGEILSKQLGIPYSGNEEEYYQGCYNCGGRGYIELTGSPVVSLLFNASNMNLPDTSMPVDKSEWH